MEYKMIFFKRSKSIARESQALSHYEKNNLVNYFEEKYCALEPLTQIWNREMKSSKIYQSVYQFLVNLTKSLHCCHKETAARTSKGEVNY